MNVSSRYIGDLLSEESEDKSLTPTEPKPPKPPQTTDNSNSDSYDDSEDNNYTPDYEASPQGTSQPGEDQTEDEYPPEGLPEEISDDIDLGRIFELKKIYARLIALDNLIEHYSEPWIDPFKDKIQEAIDIFQIIVSNINKYKDDIDDIILYYYKFIKTILLDAEVFISRNKSSEDDEA